MIFNDVNKMRFPLYILPSLMFLLSCNSQNFKPASGPAAHSTAAVVDKSTAGGISGTISFTGAAPRLLSLDMSQDPGCPSSPQQSDAVAIKNGKLGNVFVYVKEGLGEASFSSSPPGNFRCFTSGTWISMESRD